MSWRVAVIIGLLSGLVGFGLVSLMFSGRRDSSPGTRNEPATVSTQPDATRQDAPVTNANTAARNEADDDSFIGRFFGVDEGVSGPNRTESVGTTFVNVILRLTLAALLSAMLAFRPRKSSAAFKRNPFVSQTQILLAVVASALMMIVGDSAARAFGIFAAVSLVRFRTNIRDPKEITVLLVSLALGLATGVGRWDLALTLGVFVLVLLWGLEYREREQVFRAMELTVKTRSLDVTHATLRSILKRHKFNSEIRTLDREDEDDPLGCIVYAVDVSPHFSTDQLSEEILSADNHNIDSIEWNQQKNTSYFYQ